MAHKRENRKRDACKTIALSIIVVRPTTLLLLLHMFRTDFDIHTQTANGKHHYGDGVEVVFAVDNNSM